MNFSLDYRVLGFTAVASLFTVVLFGVVPALRASRIDLNESLCESGRTGSGFIHHRLRGSLVIAEIALSFALLVGSGLMMKSFLRLQSINPGFDSRSVMTMQVNLPPAKYTQDDSRREFFNKLIEGVRAVPGVQACGAISDLPINGGWSRGGLVIEDHPFGSDIEAPIVRYAVTTTGFFNTLRIPVLAGRDFTEADSDKSTNVAIIDSRIANEFWPNQNPIGKRIRAADDKIWRTIVGVSGPVLFDGLDKGAEQTVYLPHLQEPSRTMSLVIRSNTKPADIVGEVRRQLKTIDPDQPLVNVISMKDAIAQSMWQQRLYTILFGIFACIALLVATVGIYGAISYLVTQRTNEIGIRLALGAQYSDVLALILRQGVGQCLIGIALGLALSIGSTRLLRSMLFNVTENDPTVFIIVVPALFVVTLLACWVPAKRALKVDPAAVLRSL
ncbi:MAG TPA: FtsX-like permease family protein [Blastocatellia bacterium]|nr:FtsX-like permease family protein [Blastocatellia bacterium]